MTKENIYYVYIYRDPETNIPFYVGYGKNSRAYSHLRQAKNKSTPIQGEHKLNKIRKILRTDKEPIIEIYKNQLSKSEACETEIELISKYGRIDTLTGTLTNKTCGGDGKRGWSSADRDAMSKRMLGHRIVKDHITNEKYRVRIDDPRITSGELIGISIGNANKNGKITGYVLCKDPKTNNTYRVKKTDERWLSGDLVGINKGVPASENAKSAARAKKGIPKSKEHNKKVSNSIKGSKWIHNFETGITSRISKDKTNPPDGFVFVNGPFKLKTQEQLIAETNEYKIEKQKARQKKLHTIKQNNSSAQKKLWRDNPLRGLSQDDIDFIVSILKLYQTKPKINMKNSIGKMLNYNRAFSLEFSKQYKVSLHKVFSIVSGKKNRILKELSKIADIQEICNEIIDATEEKDAWEFHELQ